VVGFEEAVGEPVVAHELQMFSWGLSSGHLAGGGIKVMFEGMLACRRDAIQLDRRGLRRERPGRFAWRSRRGAGSSPRVASRHDERRALSLFRADRAETVGRSGSLIDWSARARAAPGPTAGDLVLLADPRLIGEPKLYRVGIDAPLAPNFFQARGEAFLKSSIAPSACA
jgi:hypothetical protein